MKKYLLILPLAALFAVFSCKVKKEGGDEAVTTQTEETQAANEEASEEKAPASDTQPGKTYTVADFVDVYSKDKSALKDQVVIIEGYFLNFNEQTSGGSVEQYNVSLYADETCNFEGPKAFFIFSPDTDKKDFSLKQYSKVKIQGKVTGEEFFKEPKLVEAKIVK